MHRQTSVWGVAGSTVFVLALLSAAFLPSLTGSVPRDQAHVPSVVVAWLGARGFLGFTLAGAVRRERQWLLPLGLTAAWGIGFGGIVALEAQSRIAFEDRQLAGIRERQLRPDADAKASPADVERSRDLAHEQQVRSERAREQAQAARVVGVLIFVTGLAALGLLFLALQRPVDVVSRS